ncbi:feruloyl-CoA synthase [Seohaeicola saemankumensis]|nr:feruloyl-CoA synthase [Seohaeicola saemankumensis]MCA0873237.1 feruloyl-CoA synthase [Seohaeicola saemankumensis]
MTAIADYLPHNVLREDRADGAILLKSGLEMGPVARNTGEWLHRWADETPERVFIAERDGDGWREMTYSQTLGQVRAVAAALLARGLGPGKPIVVLSGPSVDHGILTLAAQYIGAPTVPLAEQYSLIGDAHPRVVYAVEKTKPALIYAADAGPYGDALALPELAGIEKVVSIGASADNGFHAFADLLAGEPGAELDAAYAAVDHDTLAKILFTSGSTSMPKGVPQTQGMMCVNQAQYLACLPLLGARHHTIVDWLPWNHVFAGSSDFNMVLANGGSLYLDDGKPVKGLFEKTLTTLKLKTGTLSFNVPVAYAMLVDAMRKDEALKRDFFTDLDMIFYAGASLPADVWGALEDMAREVTGKVPMMTSSWGMTETAPACIIHHQGGAQTGMIGVPVPELEVKLIPEQPERYELRVRGPNVMPGYYEDPEKTAETFDDEGFLITGDAVRFIDPDDIAQGVKFDGRISEDFKLLTGTWVQAGTLRLNALAALKGLVQDVVVTGADRNSLGLLIFPDPHLHLPDGGDGTVSDADYRAQITERLHKLAEEATGSSTRIVRAMVMAEPPSVGDGEITAKGSLNNRVILTRRADLLERLYDDADAATLKV